MESDSPFGMHEGLASPGGVFVREEGEVAWKNLLEALDGEFFSNFTRRLWVENPSWDWILDTSEPEGVNEAIFPTEDELAEVFRVPYGP